jgi:hypothetical protein
VARQPERGVCVTYDAEEDARWAVRGHQIPVSHHALQFRSAAQFEQFAWDQVAFGTTQLEAAHIASFNDPSPFDDDDDDDGGSNSNSSRSRSAEGLVAFSEAVANASLGVSLWWPSSLSPADDPSLLAAAAEAFAALPRVDALFMPGGDGGDLDWATLRETARALRVAHPAAGVWVSAQDLSAAGMERFWANVTAVFDYDGSAGGAGKGEDSDEEEGRYLTGVVYGPHCRVPLTEFIQRAAAAAPPSPSNDNASSFVPVRDYPDITHTLSSQFPLSGWHSAWSLTHGRNPVVPLPRLTASLVQLRSNASYGGGVSGGAGGSPIPEGILVGFGAYSEGIGDDLNKVLWSAMGQDKRLGAAEVVAQYARYFFGADGAAAWEGVLWGLELNWGGVVRRSEEGGNSSGKQQLRKGGDTISSPGAANAAIPRTLRRVREAIRRSFGEEAGDTDEGEEGAGEEKDEEEEAAAAAGGGGTAALEALLGSGNWRAQMYAKRGFYDAYVRQRFIFEVEGSEADAYAALAAAPDTGSLAALARADAALRRRLLPDVPPFASSSSSYSSLLSSSSFSTPPGALTSRRAEAAYYRATTASLAAALNESVGGEVVGNQDTSLNMAYVDAPISDAAWLVAEVGALLAGASNASSGNASTEAERQAAIRATFTHWGDPGPGGFYDDLGGDACNFNVANRYAGGYGYGNSSAAASAAPRLVKGQGAEEDPGFYFTPLLAGPTSGGGAFLGAAGRMSWNCYAMAFFDSTDALTLSYDGVLDSDRTYQAKVVFNVQDEPGNRRGGGGSGDGKGEGSGSGSGQQNYSLMRLTANNRTTVWPPAGEENVDGYAYPPLPMQVTVVDIPKSETESGSLRLSCSQYPGLEGNGRTCQISEVWLVPV